MVAAMKGVMGLKVGKVGGRQVMGKRGFVRFPVVSEAERREQEQRTR